MGCGNCLVTGFCLESSYLHRVLWVVLISLLFHKYHNGIADADCCFCFCLDTILACVLLLDHLHHHLITTVEAKLVRPPSLSSNNDLIYYSNIVLQKVFIYVHRAQHSLVYIVLLCLTPPIVANSIILTCHYF